MISARKKALWALMLGFLAAVLAAWTSLSWLQSVNHQLGERFTTYVATQDIPALTPLTSNLVRRVEVAKTLAPGGMVDAKKNPDKYITLYTIPKGTLLTNATVGTRENIAPDTRTMAITASQQISIPQDLKTGDRIDILVVTGASAKEGTTRVLLSNLPVTAVTPGDKPSISFITTLDGAQAVIAAEKFASYVQVLRRPLTASAGGVALESTPAGNR